MCRFDVYAHTSPSGKTYVGWTSLGWEARWRKHVEDAFGGRRFPLHRAIRKYGPEAFTHELIATVSTEDEAKALEVEWIAGLGTLAPGGYNATLGGDGAAGLKQSPAVVERLRTRALGKRHSAETRAKISAAQAAGRERTPEDRAKIRDALRKPETIARMSARVGRVCTQQTRDKLRWASRRSVILRRARAAWAAVEAAP